MSFIEQLNEKFPIRRSKEQKAAFRAWFMQQAEELGYSAPEINAALKGVDPKATTVQELGLYMAGAKRNTEGGAKA